MLKLTTLFAATSAAASLAAFGAPLAAASFLVFAACVGLRMVAEAALGVGDEDE